MDVDTSRCLSFVYLLVVLRHSVVLQRVKAALSQCQYPIWCQLKSQLCYCAWENSGKNLTKKKTDYLGTNLTEV